VKTDSAQPSTLLTTLPRLQQLPARAVRAHALKNCLAVVDAANMLLACELSELDELSEQAQLRLQRSKNALRRMAKLIDEDLRAGSAADSGDSPQQLSAAQVLACVRAQAEDFAEAKGVHLEFRIGAGSLRGDLNGLVEALGNIVKNAIESSPTDSTVVVTSSRTADGGQLWSVRDAGSGISGQFIQRLGVPFHTGKPGGSGLGFAVACEIFQLHGGRVCVESAQGWGTVVSVLLPRAAATQV
jgi:signal transduction histidine kinase